MGTKRRNLASHDLLCQPQQPLRPGFVSGLHGSPAADGMQHPFRFFAECILGAFGQLGCQLNRQLFHIVCLHIGRYRADHNGVSAKVIQLHPRVPQKVQITEKRILFLCRGWVEVSFFSEALGFDVVIGEIELTECETVSRYTGTARPPCFTRGYGLVFGNNERKALSMSITDRALRAKELDEPVVGPAQNPEFVLLHGDNVDASGFVQHIKLPHYVDFQADLSLIRGLRAKRQNDKDI